MAELIRSVGLGLAARGSVTDTVEWSRRARERGLRSVWFHDSYFERDAVTYSSAVASQVDDIHVGLGALNPYTRHPVLIAMTISALDEMAPGRIILGLGSALPLRLGQMGIPYKPAEAVGHVSDAIEQMRTLWRGERLPVVNEKLPPLQAMFAPVHHVPIYVAGYRSPMVKLAGRTADGYLARPAESIPGVRKIVSVLRAASIEAGRPEDAVQTAGYLLALVGSTRREALNRAKREPFVIYMMSILSDVSLQRAGFEPSLRDNIAAAWRAENYHEAAELIPDELVDAFILCGTAGEVAQRTDDYYEAGLQTPIVQPIVQEGEQVISCMEAAAIYGRREAAHAGAPARVDESTRPAPSGEDRRRTRLGLGAVWEIARPFSFTASVVPVCAGAALAALAGPFSWSLFLAALVAAVLLQLGTNVINEIYDVRRGIDSIVSPRASQAIVKGRINERAAFGIAALAFGAAAAIGVYLVVRRGVPVVVLGLLGLLGGFGYTAPPLQYKYRALGLPLVFLLMGPLMVVGSYYVVTGELDVEPFVLSIPVGFLVAAILHGNEWRDISEDARAGIKTLSIRYGRTAAHVVYVSLILGAYIVLALAVMLEVLPVGALLAMLSLPLLVRIIRNAELGAGGQQRAIAMIDLQTAQLHAAFGLLLVGGLVLSYLST
ncbi:MAG: LLM class flavin-dependent oxidoreductase [Actinomycetota bacterium]|nr:LLM class flavin-dependent oxidoreductase [Actinomycetota bacterium]